MVIASPPVEAVAVVRVLLLRVLHTRYGFLALMNTVHRIVY